MRLHGADGLGRRRPSRRSSASATAPTAREVVALERPTPNWRGRSIEGLPYSRAEVVYAVRNEMARTVDDVLSRRTRARLLARDASAAAADDVAALMGDELGWSRRRTRRARSRRTARSSTRNARAGGLPETALDALSQPPA